MTHSFSVVTVREAWSPSWLGRVSTVGTNAALRRVNVLFVGGGGGGYSLKEPMSQY